MRCMPKLAVPARLLNLCRAPFELRAPLIRGRRYHGGLDSGDTSLCHLVNSDYSTVNNYDGSGDGLLFKEDHHCLALTFQTCN